MKSRKVERRQDGWLKQLREERETIEALAAKANLGSELIYDIHLCYGDVPEMGFKGFMVSSRGNLDNPIAFCPIRDSLLQEESLRAAEVARSFSSAVQVATDSLRKKESDYVIWVDNLIGVGSAMPGWMYGFSCIPLNTDWDGRFHSPRPFCPVLFAKMAEQPRALEWLTKWSQQAISLPKKLPILSKRVAEVLACLKSGYSEKETARELGISAHTAHVHVKRLYRQLGVHSRGELLSLFLRSSRIAKAQDYVDREDI